MTIRPVVDVVQPVQQGVDVGDLQLVISDGLQSPSNCLVVALHVHLMGGRSKVKVPLDRYELE